jgi:Ca2+-binding RTX toxin-like protein
MYGSEGNDYLSGGAGNDRLYGGKGDDIMEGGSGKNTFLGGAGKDCFRFFSTTGKSSDTVLDFKAGLDIIEFGDNNLSIASSEVKEGNVTLHMNGGGTINILNAAGQEITFYSKEQSTFTRIFS